MAFYNCKAGDKFNEDFAAFLPDLFRRIGPMLTNFTIRFLTEFFLSAFVRNFFLCQDRVHGDVPPHLAQSCYLALGGL